MAAAASNWLWRSGRRQGESGEMQAAAMTGPTDLPARTWVAGPPMRGVKDEPSWKPEAVAAMAKSKLSLNICRIEKKC